jgi:hypothetical protein
VKPLHRIPCIMTLLSIVTGALQAQGIDTTRTNLPPIPPPTKSFLVAGLNDTLWLSDAPTLFELTKIFAAPGRGRLDPFAALQAVIGKGDSAVSALDSLLFSDPIAEIITTRMRIGTGVGGDPGREIAKSDTVRPNKLYAVMALEGIGTKASYPVLVRTAQLHPNIDVRGIALNAFASTYHEGERLQKFVPDKELLHLLLANVDDTTSVPYLAKSFGQIAREGLIRWLGQDFGEPQGATRRLHDAKGADRGSLTDYREQWWTTIGSKLSWDENSQKFLHN